MDSYVHLTGGFAIVFIGYPRGPQAAKATNPNIPVIVYNTPAKDVPPTKTLVIDCIFLSESSP